MLITTAHLFALQALAANEAAGKTAYTPTADEEQEFVYRGLELQGLVSLEIPRAYRLTYAGREALSLLAAMREAALLPPIEQLKSSWRFLGSDTLAALYAAQQRKRQVGPLAMQLLSDRGMTETFYDALEKRSAMRLNQYGVAWADFASRYRPRLEINGELANSIHKMHPGYVGRPDLHMPLEHIALLEAMDLLTWSVPERTIYTLTELGQAVHEALLNAGYAPLDAVLDESILEVLAILIDRGSEALTSEQMLNLQMLGYVEMDGSVSAPGQAAMRAYSLLQQERPGQAHTFAITEAEGELLATIQQLRDPPNNSQMPPDKKTLHRVLVDRMVKRYQEFSGRYGRTVRERSAKKRQALAMLEQMKDRDKWFDSFWNLEDLLLSLGAFDLIRAESSGPDTVYRLTPNGSSIVAEQRGNPRDISSTAVKALTIATTRFHTPADSWVEQAREEELIGTGGITKSGKFYAELAEHCARIPALTREEAAVLANLPETARETSSPAAKDYSSLDEEKQDWALEKLEARSLIERLVDGQIIRTDAGMLLARVVSGALQLGHPVTPDIVRLLAAIRQVGTLYVRERKVHIVPHQWAEVERLTGLEPPAFREVVHIARLGQYIGEVHITEAGLDLLAAQEQLESKPNRIRNSNG